MQYIPILKLVYESIEGKTNYSQLYIFLIFILIFSQDDVFNESIQKFVSGFYVCLVKQAVLNP